MAQYIEYFGGSSDPPSPPTSKRSLPTRGRWTSPKNFACGALKIEHHLTKDSYRPGGGRWVGVIWADFMPLIPNGRRSPLTGGMVFGL
jgi:hypothetical protein